MTRDAPSVCIVSVTYGDREHLLRQVVAAIWVLTRSDRIAKLILVANGVSDNTRQFLKRLDDSEPRLQVVWLAENTGSAAGFGAGLRAAGETDCDFVWLLDDDNFPERDALDALLRHAAIDPNAAYLSLRTDRAEYTEYLSNGGSTPTESADDSFLGFSLWRKLARRRRLTSDPVEQGGMKRISHAPYGGLLLPLVLLKRIGYPRVDFFIYADDHEFSLRLRRAGVPIFLVPASRVRDLENSWCAKQGTPARFVKPHLHLIDRKAEPRRRLYYSIRNQVFVECRLREGNGIKYLMNGLFLTAATTLLAVLASVYHHNAAPLAGLPVYYLAVSHGLRGKLGRLPSEIMHARTPFSDPQ